MNCPFIATVITNLFRILNTVTWSLIVSAYAIAEVEKSKTIPIEDVSFSTGTVFSDHSGWGELTGSIFIGQNDEFGHAHAGGWLRFDTTDIPDHAIIESVVLNFSTYGADDEGPKVDFVQLKTDPAQISFPTRWGELVYGSAYLINVTLRTGDWRLDTGDAGASQLQAYLNRDWFGIGIRCLSRRNRHIYLSGRDHHTPASIYVEYLIPEQIKNVRWLKPLEIKEGETAVMLAELEGFPVGTKAHWEVWEAGRFRDLKVDNPQLIHHDVWTTDDRYYAKAEWITDCRDELRGKADYYFVLTIGSQSAESSLRELDMLRIEIGPDQKPPTPNPMTFSKKPTVISSTSIRMEATLATDPERNEIEYYFLCGTNGGGGDHSGWISDRSYTDIDLTPNSRYGYRVKARDRSPNQNQSAYSDDVYVYTFANRPRIPAFEQFSPYSLKLIIPEDGNPDNTEYCIFSTTLNYYVNVDGAPQSETVVWKARADWQNSVISGLSPSTAYRFIAKARNYKRVETDWSHPGAAMTLPIPPDLYVSRLSFTSVVGSDDLIRVIGAVDITNHPAAGLLNGQWQLEWGMSENEMIGDADDVILKQSTWQHVYAPGQVRTYSFNHQISGTLNRVGDIGFVRIADVPGETNITNNIGFRPLSDMMDFVSN